MTAVIRAEGLSKRYGRTLAVDTVSFEVGKGRVVGLIGPNGVGKSSTLKAVLGLARYSGKLEVLGRDPVRERARLLVLDEPTLGLDVLYRRKFYSQLLDEYFHGERTILFTTHQIEEVEHILTDIIFMHRGRIILDMPVEEIPQQFAQVIVSNERLEVARALNPLYEEELLNRKRMLFRRPPREQLEALGEVSAPRLADLFVACIEAADRGFLKPAA